jgi:hypothetical protein
MIASTVLILVATRPRLTLIAISAWLPNLEGAGGS